MQKVLILRSWHKLKTILARLRARRNTIVFTNGCYDLLHPGHITLLAKAKALGDALIVGVNSDASVRRLKGPGRPILKLEERLIVLSALRSIDYLVPFSRNTPEILIKRIRPDILVKGADWNAAQIVGRAFAKRVVRLPLVAGLSTTNIIKRIRQKK